MRPEGEKEDRADGQACQASSKGGRDPEAGASRRPERRLNRKQRRLELIQIDPYRLDRLERRLGPLSLSQPGFERAPVVTDRLARL